jgi:hypothetical protein
MPTPSRGHGTKDRTRPSKGAEALRLRPLLSALVVGRKRSLHEVNAAPLRDLVGLPADVDAAGPAQGQIVADVL